MADAGRGGAHEAVVERYSGLTRLAAGGALDGWAKTQFRIPLEHCEGPDHLAHLDLSIAIADTLTEEAPAHLRPCYLAGAQQPRKHRAVIAAFGRHPHRNAVLGRVSSAEEAAYLAMGKFPHLTDLAALTRGSAAP